MNELVVIRGAGDLATGVAYRLYKSGFKVIMLDIEEPLVIRRTVAFAQAIYDGETEVEGVRAVKASTLDEIARAIQNGHIPVVVDSEGKTIKDVRPKIVVDAILAKKNYGTHKDMADIVVALGPGFKAGVDADAVVETKRGHYLGRLILEGEAIPNTGVPGVIEGESERRVIHSPASGIIAHKSKITDLVSAGDTIAMVGDVEVKTEISGVLRGLIQEGIEVEEGLKVADVDPRDVRDHCHTISDKARSLGGGVLEAILNRQYFGEQ